MTPSFKPPGTVKEPRYVENRNQWSTYMRKFGKRHEIILAVSFLVCQLTLEIIGASLYVQIYFAFVEFVAAIAIILRKAGGANRSG